MKAYWRLLRKPVLRSSISSMGEEEERRELSDGLKEGLLLSPCSTDNELGLSSRAWAETAPLHTFTQNIRITTSYYISITHSTLRNVQHFKHFPWHLPSYFWPALQWRWLTRQHWAFLSWRGELKDGMMSVENKRGKKMVKTSFGQIIRICWNKWYAFNLVL